MVVQNGNVSLTSRPKPRGLAGSAERLFENFYSDGHLMAFSALSVFSRTECPLRSRWQGFAGTIVGARCCNAPLNFSEFLCTITRH